MWENNRVKVFFWKWRPGERCGVGVGLGLGGLDDNVGFRGDGLE